MHSPNPRVSVIIPTFNRADFISECINSVLMQSYQDFEIIVIDDRSSDNTKEAVLPFLEDKRVHYYRLERNSGPAVARNVGIANASGGYIAFLDSDDLWYSKKLETQMALVESRGLDWIASQIEDVNLATTQSQIRGHIDLGKNRLVQVLSSGCSIPMSTIIVKRSLLGHLNVFDEVRYLGLGGYPKCLYGTEHFELVMKLTSSKFECLLLREPLAKYRNHGNNISIDQNPYLGYAVHLLTAAKYFNVVDRWYLLKYGCVYILKGGLLSFRRACHVLKRNVGARFERQGLSSNTKGVD